MSLLGLFMFTFPHHNILMNSRTVTKMINILRIIILLSASSEFDKLIDAFISFSPCTHICNAFVKF